MHWQRVRIISPAARELSYRVTDQQKVPAATLRGNVREFEWEWHDLSGTPADEDRPRWHNAWPNLQVSTSRNWADVATPAAQLFVVDEPPGFELLNVVAEAAHDTRRTLRLLEKRGQAKDHPMVISVPETGYLKCLIFYVSY